MERIIVGDRVRFIRYKKETGVVRKMWHNAKGEHYADVKFDSGGSGDYLIKALERRK